RHHDHQERHQRRAWLALRNRPQQRLRRGAPASGHVHQGAAPGAQRIRRVPRRAGVPAQDLQRQEPHLLLRLLGRVAPAPRGDHNIGDKDRIFGRYSPGHWDLLQRRSFSTGGFPITSDGLYNRETYLELSHTAMASWTHTFTPRLFVESVFTTSLINWLYSY